PIRRLAFAHSPGRWHFKAPCCGRPVGILLAAVTNDGCILDWRCRRCAGERPVAWRLGPAERVHRAAERAAAAPARRRWEKPHDYAKRLRRAALARQHAAGLRAADVTRLEKWLGR